jgi:hypothetical protein
VTTIYTVGSAGSSGENTPLEQQVGPTGTQISDTMDAFWRNAYSRELKEKETFGKKHRNCRQRETMGMEGN